MPVLPGLLGWMDCKGGDVNSAEFDAAMADNRLDDAFSEYLINHSGARIGNGDMLIEAMESGYYYDEFKDYFLGVTA